MFFVSFYSYSNLIDIADHLFPPVTEDDCSAHDEYSNFNYWRDPVMDIPLDDIVLNSGSAKNSPKGKSPKKQPPQQKKDDQQAELDDTGRNNTSLSTIPEK